MRVKGQSSSLKKLRIEKSSTLRKSASQMVCMGVYLLTPGKKAYLKQYKDLGEDLVGGGRRFAIVWKLESRCWLSLEDKHIMVVRL